MRVVVFFLIVCASVIGGCSKPAKDCSYNDTMSVINEYSKLIKKKENIRLFGYGLDYSGRDKKYDGKIHVISLAYDVDKNMKYEEARAYFYSIVDGLLAHVNKNTQLKQYFYHFPVDYRDLEIHFTFENEKTGALRRDDVQSIHIQGNKIFYEIVDREGPNVIEKDKISSDIYIMKNMLQNNRSIKRTVSEDLALHSK